MSLRPRYSLLTLLVVTAMIAGGVKLWYGPHHVVEQLTPNIEMEYHYTRNWRGDKIIQGPRVCRTFYDGKLVGVAVSYFRQGNNCEWDYQCLIKTTDYHPVNLEQMDENFACPLTPEERHLLHEVRDREKEKIAAAKMSCEAEYEGHSIFYHFKELGR